MKVAMIDESYELILSTAQCEDALRRVLDLEAFWIARHPRFPFHTLGATNYYDIVGHAVPPYRRLARQYNPLLLDQFGDLYRALLAALRVQLAAPVAFCPDAALPGFHVFGADPAFAASAGHDLTHEQWFARRDGDAFPGNPIHVDSAHLALGLGDAPTISFTLAIALPRQGAGMRIWPFGRAEGGGTRQDELAAMLHASPTRDIAYAAGGLLVHSGDRYHQARGLPCEPGQWRITLQGHGALLGGQWQLFW
jgi:hypothetical protein